MPDSSVAILAALDLSDLPEGEVLRTLEPLSAAERAFLESWETPLTQWGGFKVASDIRVEAGPEDRWLRFGRTRSGAAERALVCGDASLRDARITATVEPVDREAGPHVDRRDCTEALAGIVFRMETSRRYYQFGVEGRRRLVLYRRRDDEWYELTARDVQLPDGPLTLCVDLDADGIRARCDELDVDLHVTDTCLPSGRAGYRSLGESVLRDLRVEAAPWQERRNARRASRLHAELEARGAAAPPPVLVDTLDVAALGGAPQFCDFAAEGRHDLLVVADDGLRAVSSDGEELWRLDEAVRNPVLSSTGDPGGGRLIYAFAGERKVVERANVSGAVATTVVQSQMLVIRGRDGHVLARADLPPEEGDMRFFDWSPGTASLQDPAGFDIVLREWRQDMGGGGCRLWALDRDLEVLWHQRQEGAHYGHHWALAFCDVDGDGREELLAGGYLYDGDGNVLWRHDGHAEMETVNGAGHYDAVALGHFSDDPDTDPVAFLLGGSAGVYVVDARTGRTRAVHRIGHAQGRVVGRLRPDLPGTQVVAVTRWGNFGIITLLAGDGSRLWTIQPDYVGQGCDVVDWAGRTLLWTNTSRRAQGLYDGNGQLVRPLPELSEAYGDAPRLEVTAAVVRRGEDPHQYLALGKEGKLHIFGPAA